MFNHRLALFTITPHQGDAVYGLLRSLPPLLNLYLFLLSVSAFPGPVMLPLSDYESG